ncbi:MAG: class I SAM-dependent methyltransferase [Verrucomicrobia bacterium]|nr:class I SAM-dependent methyltransferase [Verrucomicrobiota bacterium]
MLSRSHPNPKATLNLPEGWRRALRRGRDRVHDWLGQLTTRHMDQLLSQEIAACEAAKTGEGLRDLTLLQSQPGRLATAWAPLGPVTYELVRRRRPHQVVELGSFGGYSTCCLGLAIRDHVPGGQLVAVDLWEGDRQTGRYDERVYRQFLEFRQELGLEEIIRPLRNSFAAASREIRPGVDLLHIDGLHQFTHVGADFLRFRRLLAPGALVMFHDVNAHFTGMRVFWWLISRRYPAALIPYSHGLGIIQCPPWEATGR